VTRPIAVLGLGGIGGMLAARTGALCVGTERTVEAIRERGLRLVHEGDTTVSHPEATTRLETPVSLLVIAVKAYDLEAALDRVAPEALGEAVILPLQNGLEHVEAIRARVASPSSRPVQRPPAVAAGSIGHLSASSPEPGVVVQTTHAGGTIRAASRDTAPGELAGRLAPLAAAGIEVAVAGGEGDVLWEKAARLAVLAAATVASGRTVGPLRGDAAWRPRLEAALAEACAVAAADGVELDAGAQWAIIEAMPDDLSTSAARDAASGGPTELDAIAGSVVRAGVRLGVPTPSLRRLVEEAACRAP
jgi:2-dehydropantoate 2-reductase